MAHIRTSVAAATTAVPRHHHYPHLRRHHHHHHHHRHRRLHHHPRRLHHHPRPHQRRRAKASPSCAMQRQSAAIPLQEDIFNWVNLTRRASAPLPRPPIRARRSSSRHVSQSGVVAAAPRLIRDHRIAGGMSTRSFAHPHLRAHHCHRHHYPCPHHHRPRHCRLHHHPRRLHPSHRRHQRRRAKASPSCAMQRQSAAI